MLKKILMSNECAKCRICCVFDETDIWEVPVISEAVAKRIRESHIESILLPHGKSSYTLASKLIEGSNLLACPMLGDSGCMLGDEKPFDCKIWPFRVMEWGGKQVIGLSPVCDSVYSKPLSEVMGVLEDGLGEDILKYALEHEDIVKAYIEGYPILYSLK